MYDCCYLHVGMPRAGSKAIQLSLAENRLELSRAGFDVFAPSAGFHPASLATYANPDVPDAVRALSRADASGEEFAAEMNALFEEAGALGAPDRSVVLSSEYLFEYARSRENWISLRELVTRLARRVTVVLFLRRQDRVAISLADQAIHEGGGVEVSLLPHPGDPLRNLLRYSEFIETLHEVFAGSEDQIIVTAVDETEPATDIVAEFYDILKVPDRSALAAVPRLRESLSSPAQAFLALFNKSVPYVQDGAINPLRDNIVELLYAVKGKRRLPVRGRAKKFLSDYLEDNRRVLTLVSGEEAGGQLFDADFSDYPEDPLDRTLTVQRAVAIAAMLWKQRTEELVALRAEVAALRGPRPD